VAGSVNQDKVFCAQCRLANISTPLQLVVEQTATVTYPEWTLVRLVTGSAATTALIADPIEVDEHVVMRRRSQFATLRCPTHGDVSTDELDVRLVDEPTTEEPS
jgi:hypothetical protein